jgi:hypothetical protein
VVDPQDTSDTGQAGPHRSRRRPGITQPSSDSGESRYPPGPAAPAQKKTAAASNESRFEPLAVRVELVIIDGPAAKELLGRQARVIREALLWFAEHRLDQPGADPREERRSDDST